MDIASLIGLIGGFFVIIVGLLIGGGVLTAYIDISSVFIVIASSFLAIVYAYPFSIVRQLPGLFRRSLQKIQHKNSDLLIELINLSSLARREGLLSLENRLPDIEDGFLRNGIQLLVDGTTPEAIRSILYHSIDAMEYRHEESQKMIDTWAKLAPAFGLIGTLIGLVALLGKLSDKASIGPSMALALLTTFYGAILANLFLTPCLEKLRMRTQSELRVKTMIVEGILAIQSGDNPKVVEKRLLTFLSDKEVNVFKQSNV